MGDNTERRLNDLMREYRGACGLPEGSANFMPGVWQRIEARRSWGFPMRRMVGRFVTASLAICMVLGLILVTPLPQNHSTISLAAYIEALADENDIVALADAHQDPDGDGLGYVGSQGYVE